MNHQSKVSILIPAYNEEYFIGKTIDSIHHSFKAIQYRFYEIIVCDNNSTDNTAMIATSKGARVVFESHQQIARARNRAAEAATGTYLIFIDADTKLNSKVLKETLQNFESGKTGAGGAIMVLDQDNLSWMSKALSTCLVCVWNYISRIFKTPAGAYVYCLRNAWKDVGGFDERFYVTEEGWFGLKLNSWCKCRNLKFHIISSHPVTTSSRKLQWYSTWQTIKQAKLLLMPWKTMNRKHCDVWYTRPIS